LNAASHQIYSGGIGCKRLDGVIRQTDARAISSVARVSRQLRVDLTLHPETTNIKLVARWRELIARERERREPPDSFWWCRGQASLQGQSTNRRASNIKRRAVLQTIGRRFDSSPGNHQHQVGGSLM